MSEIDDRIAAIRNDYAHGATFLTIEAVRTLGTAAQQYGTGQGWEDYLVSIANDLAETKPAMASVRNATQQLLVELTSLGRDEASAQSEALVDRLLARLRSDAGAAAEHAERLIEPGMTVATCSYSSAVLRVARLAYAAGKAPRILVCEAAPTAPSPGHSLAMELEKSGLSVEVEGSPDIIVDQTSLAVTGADAVATDFIVNGSPTLALARACYGRIPYYVVSESVKMTTRAISAPGYDLVPADLVTGVVTEEGMNPVADL